MANRLVSVGDDSYLPTTVRVADINLPSWVQQSDVSGKVSKGERWANVRDYFGPNRVEGVTDDRPAFETARLTGRPVYAPAGMYYLSSSPAWGNNAICVGDGKRRTVIKLLDSAPGEINLWTNAELTGTVQGYFADFTLDGNCQRQGGMLNTAGGSTGSGFTLRNAQHFYIDRVSVINPLQHGFDVTRGAIDYPYAGDGVLASLRSSDIHFNQCDASNFGDDGFTCHSSDYITYTRCLGFNPRLRENCNAFEIDGDSRYVTLNNNRSYGCYGGIEIKGHDNESAAQGVTINGHISTRDVRSYHFRHIGHHIASDPKSLSAYDITGNNMVSIFPGNRYGFQGETTAAALHISAYANVQITDFTAIGDPTYDFLTEPVVVLKYMTNNVTLKGMNFRDFKNSSTDIYVTGGSNMADRITIDGVNSRNSSYSVIGVGTGNPLVNISNINAVAPAVGAEYGIDAGFSTANLHVTETLSLVGYPVAVRYESTNHTLARSYFRRLRGIPAGTTTMKALDPTKDFYADTATFALFGTDRPAGATGGYFITHTRVTSVTVKQTITRNTTVTPVEYWRIVDFAAQTSSDWQQSTAPAVAYSAT